MQPSFSLVQKVGLHCPVWGCGELAGDLQVEQLVTILSRLG